MKNYMKVAIDLAEKSFKKGEVPVGAVIVCDGKIIGKGYNKKESKKDVTMHAEIVAIRKACKKKKSWHLDDSILYVTMEPCMMCMGAILQSHIKKIVFSTYNDKFGSIKKLSTAEKKNIVFEYISDNEKIEKLLKSFFKDKRK